MSSRRGAAYVLMAASFGCLAAIALAVIPAGAQSDPTTTTSPTTLLPTTELDPTTTTEAPTTTAPPVTEAPPPTAASTTTRPPGTTSTTAPPPQPPPEYRTPPRQPGQSPVPANTPDAEVIKPVNGEMPMLIPILTLAGFAVLGGLLGAQRFLTRLDRRGRTL